MPAQNLKTMLISVTAYSSDGPKLLRQAYKDISQGVEIIRASSIYKVRGKSYSPSHIHDIRSVTTFEGLCIALEIQTVLSPVQVLELLKEVERLRKSELLHRSLSLNLLLCEDMTLMTPELTLPYPDLHERPDLAIPAAELWGEHQHPVLNVSLYQLTKAFVNEDWGEFFAQGQSLLDF